MRPPTPTSKKRGRERRPLSRSVGRSVEREAAMESDVRKLLVNKIARNIYEALLDKRATVSTVHQEVKIAGPQYSTPE